jgi:hypothetical protein
MGADNFMERRSERERAERLEQEASGAFALLMTVLASGELGPALRKKIVAHCERYSQRTR